MQRKKNKIIKIYLASLIVLFIFSPLTSLAQDGTESNGQRYEGLLQNIIDVFKPFQDKAQLPTQEGVDIVIIVVNLVNFTLGLLGLIFIIMIIYAGFLFLTAAGKAEQTKNAVTIIKNSTIGVAIVVFSWVFVNYILTQFVKAVIFK